MEGDAPPAGPVTRLTAASLLDALGRPAVRERGSDLVVDVPAPAHPDGTLLVRVRPCEDRWLLDDDGALADQVGPSLDPVLAGLRRAGLDLELDDAGNVSTGPCRDDELAGAVLRFASSLAVVPVAARLDGTATAEQAVGVADRGTAEDALWSADQGDWGSDSLRESARRFQEDSLRRWTR